MKTKFISDLVLMYGDVEPERKEKFIFELTRVLHDITGGDFNIIRKNSEKNERDSPRHWSSLLNVILEQAGLGELELQGINFNWGNNLPNPSFEKLDRILCCIDWEESYLLTKVIALVRDKSAILLCLSILEMCPM